MSSQIPIERMSVAEKLEAMELLWGSLRELPDQIPVPDWHREILDERQRRLESGQASVSSLEDVR
ncbi:MAG: addiction module protein [Pirellulales bacterium]